MLSALFGTPLPRCLLRGSERLQFANLLVGVAGLIIRELLRAAPAQRRLAVWLLLLPSLAFVLPGFLLSNASLWWCKWMAAAILHPSEMVDKYILRLGCFSGQTLMFLAYLHTYQLIYQFLFFSRYAIWYNRSICLILSGKVPCRDRKTDFISALTPSLMLLWSSCLSTDRAPCAICALDDWD